MTSVQLAAPAYGDAFAALAQCEAQPVVQLIILPSEGLERARPRIRLSSFIAHPGPELEALMRSAAFRATEHKYDI